MSRLVLASVSLLMFSSVAFAADLAPAPVEPAAPVAAPSYVWTGFYGGAQAAYSWGNSDGSNYSLSGLGVEYEGSVDSNGFSGGAYLGANYQFENSAFVVGAEIDAKYGAINGRDDLIGVGESLGRANSPTSARVTWDGAARLRIGYAFDRFLPYIAGGVAGADFRWRPVYPIDRSVPHKKWMWGWTIGAGLEYAITDNLIARIEYRYTDYGKKTEEDYKPTAIADGRYNDDWDLSTNDIRVGLAYKF